MYAQADAVLVEFNSIWCRRFSWLQNF